MNRTMARTFALLLATLVGSMQMVGCSGEVSFTTANLSEAMLAEGIDSEGKPIGVTNVFEIDTPEIFCSAKLSNAPDDTEILSEWYYVSGELEDVENLLIDSVPFTADGSQYLQFSLTIPDNGWPRGSYKLVLYIDGKEEVTLPFTVGSADNPFAATGSSATLTEPVMALGVDAEARPVNPTTTFAVDTPEIYCSVKLNDAPAGTQILSEWYYVKGEVADVTNLLIDSVPLTADGTLYLKFWLQKPDNGWPKGEYRLDFYLNGTAALSVPFSVGDATNPFVPASPATPISEATMARGVNADGTPENITSTFDVNTPEIYTSMWVEGPPAGTQLGAEWYYISGEVEGLTDYLMDSVEIEIEEANYYYFYYPRPDGGWPRGNYAIVLYLDGVQQTSLPFTVS
ncbi:MAG: hypothetical protein JW846_04770 [Dehalococcoidia bacterium]|nr:hypothetical protein [Dehalococcoidia bacterium]